MSSFVTMALGLMEFAPLIAKLVGGSDSGEVAEKIVESAQNLTGSDDIHQVRNTLRNSPEAQLQFQREIERLLIDDRSNARLRDTSIFQGGRRNLRGDIMVLSALLGLLGCLAALTIFKMSLSGEVVGIVSTIAGIFGSCLKDAYAFEFGSSRGSKEKESHLIDLLSGALNQNSKSK
jgi:hypothetical protein